MAWEGNPEGFARSRRSLGGTHRGETQLGKERYPWRGLPNSETLWGWACTPRNPSDPLWKPVCAGGANMGTINVHVPFKGREPWPPIASGGPDNKGGLPRGAGLRCIPGKARVSKRGRPFPSTNPPRVRGGISDGIYTGAPRMGAIDPRKQRKMSAAYLPDHTRKTASCLSGRCPSGSFRHRVPLIVAVEALVPSLFCKPQQEVLATDIRVIFCFRIYDILFLRRHPVVPRCPWVGDVGGGLH